MICEDDKSNTSEYCYMQTSTIIIIIYYYYYYKKYSTTTTYICLDKGYDYPEVYELLEEYGYTMHICKRGGEEYNNGNKKKKKRIPKYRARRWVVERTHSWMNRFRRLLIRWEKKENNYIAILHFACAWMTYNRGGVFG
jgi:putative transposase